ncbi:MAG: anaerobic ribonucleoside-triphosphate reductase activating protein [Oscillospiraceae bacterium]|nr:anaerobic ribonucleoside-triphosphate reductase activating protein [Oscillospiraceae bacterium]
MDIAGLQKMTLLDFPGRVACTVFTQGCNFRCPFCHNSDLLPAGGEPFMNDEQLLEFLKKRVGLLDGVCITGGEPTMQPELPDLLRKIKDLGYGVKLDTNGTNTKMLQQMVEEGLLDYVAMDIKNSAAAYPETAGMDERLLPKVEEGIAYLLSGKVDYEFRTTVVAELHTEDTIEDMGHWVQGIGNGKKAKRWFLQAFADRDSVLFAELHAPDKEEMARFALKLKPFAEFVDLRGVE